MTSVTLKYNPHKHIIESEPIRLNTAAVDEDMAVVVVSEHWRVMKYLMEMFVGGEAGSSVGEQCLNCSTCPARQIKQQEAPEWLSWGPDQAHPDPRSMPDGEVNLWRVLGVSCRLLGEIIPEINELRDSGRLPCQQEHVIEIGG